MGDLLAKVEGEADGTKGGDLFSNKYWTLENSQLF